MVVKGPGGMYLDIGRDNQLHKQIVAYGENHKVGGGRGLVGGGGGGGGDRQHGYSIKFNVLTLYNSHRLLSSVPKQGPDLQTHRSRPYLYHGSYLIIKVIEKSNRQ